jgi:Fungalysin metallopeptidase (M36)
VRAGSRSRTAFAVLTAAGAVCAGVGASGTAARAGTAAPPSEPGTAAKRALAVAADGARAASAQLAARSPIAVPGGGSIHRLRQRVGGLPVLGAEIVVAHPADRPPLIVADETVAGLEPPARAISIGRGEAIDRAREASGVARMRRAPGARLFLEGSTGEPAWEVRLAAAAPLADLAVLVDAASGEVIRTHDLLRRATGAATLFSPNPVVTQGTDAGLRDRKDRDSDLLTGLRVPVALPRITSPDGCLRGTYVVVRVGRKPRNVCKPTFDWSGVRRSADAFEALMAYFHIDRTRAYLDTLALSRGLRARPQSVVANGLRADNSFYAPFDRRVTFGTGGVDDGEDGDVIVHEYGHAVQDMQARFFGEHFEGASMGEGFADYLTAVMSSLTTGGSPAFDPCMFEWDATSYSPDRCLRRTDRAVTKRQAKRRCMGSPHCTGEAWSGALSDLRVALGVDDAGRSVGDRVVLESHFMLGRRSNFRDGARALLAADQLLYAGVHTATIGAELVERGFCESPTC